MVAELIKLGHYFQAAEDVSIKADSDFLTRYIIFIEDLTALYVKGPAQVPQLIGKLAEFIHDYVPEAVRKKPVALYRYQPYQVKTVTTEVDGHRSTDFRFLVTSTTAITAPPAAPNDPVAAVMADSRLFSTLAYASVLDDLPLRSPRVRDALKGAFNEEQLKAMINTFRQKHPGATDNDVARYFAAEVLPNSSSVLDAYNLDTVEKHTIREHLTEQEIRRVLEAYEDALTTQRTRGFSELDLKRMFRDAIRRKGQNNGESVIDTLTIPQIDKDWLKRKFTEQQLIDILKSFKEKKPGATSAELTKMMDDLLDEHAGLSVEQILTMVGKKKFEGEDEDDAPYVDKMGRNTQGQKTGMKRIPPTMVEEGLPEWTVSEKKLVVNEPKDLYHALESYTHAGRVVFKVPEYVMWYVSQEVATWVAFKTQGAETFDNLTFADVINMPAIFQITVKDPDKMLPVAPHKLKFIFQQYNADFILRNYGQQKKALRELRLAAVRLSRIFRTKGMYKVLVHHSDPFKKVIPLHAFQIDRSKAKLADTPDANSRKVATLIEGLLKL